MVELPKPHDEFETSMNEVILTSSYWAISRAFVRHTKMFLVCGFLGVVIGLCLALYPDRQYTSSASLIPQNGSSQTSMFAGFAAQLGVDIPTAEGNQAPGLYLSVLRSRSTLRDVVLHAYTVLGRPDRKTLVALFHVHGATEPERIEHTIDEVAKITTASRDRESGIIQITATTSWPNISTQIVAQLLEALNQANLALRQGRASAEREFVEGRLRDVGNQLRMSEERQRTFFDENRQFQSAPGLRLEADRLARDVAFQQQVFTGLSQAYEQARIDEVRNTPTVAILEAPRDPILPNPRKTIMKVTVGLFLGLGIAGLLSLLLEYRIAQREEVPANF